MSQSPKKKNVNKEETTTVLRRNSAQILQKGRCCTGCSGSGRRGTVPRELTTKKLTKNTRKHMDVFRVRLSMLVMLLLLSMMVVVESFSPLPDGDGCHYDTSYDTSEGCSRKSTDNTLNSIVDRWLNTTTRAAVETIYGPIGDWNVTKVKNFANLFYGHCPYLCSNELKIYVALKKTFNADISKWNVAAAENMQASECDCCMTPQIIFLGSSVNVFFLSSTFLTFFLSLHLFLSVSFLKLFNIIHINLYGGSIKWQCFLKRMRSMVIYQSGRQAQSPTWDICFEMPKRSITKQHLTLHGTFLT